ncbi:hypothetical protein GCM10027063_38200 [Promicromonospora xylanilytica]
MTGVDEAANRLESMSGLEEAILTDLTTRNFGFSVDLLFLIPVGAASGTGHERRVRIELDGVHRLLLQGGLTEQMISSPESINWGLGEVALVRIGQEEEGRASIEVLWEGDRKIEAISQGIAIVEL